MKASIALSDNVRDLKAEVVQLELKMTRVSSATVAKVVALAAMAVAATVSVAWAGTWVYGYGYSRSVAMNDANARAREQAAGSRTCYRQARGENCSERGGEWTCRAEVTHHVNENPGGICPY
jgi:hypothetical protein